MFAGESERPEAAIKRALGHRIKEFSTSELDELFSNVSAVMYIHTYIHTCMHTYMHAYMHTSWMSCSVM